VSEQQNGVLGTAQTGGTSEGSGGDNLLASLVGEGKKYKTVEDLAKSRVEADLFIDTLKTENRAFREAMLSGDEGSIRAALAALSPKQGDPATQQKGNQSQTQSSLTKEEILDIVNERERTLAAQANVSMYNATVTKLFGEKAQNVINAKLAELKVSPEQFTKLVETSPKAAMSLVGIREDMQAQTTQPVGKGTAPVNSEAFFANSDNSTENWAYFQRMRKELKQDYYKPEVQQRVMAARKKLGDAFWK